MHRIERLTSLRGFAAIYIVLFHAWGTVPGFDLSPWTNFVGKGYLAVDFFFVLSGFIIAYVYAAQFDHGEGRYKRFLFLRLARIYPVHVVMLAVVFAFWGFGDTLLFSNTPRTLAANVLLVHSWGVTRKLSFNFPSWSISAEWFAYLLFPVMLRLTRSAAVRPTVAVTGAIASIIFLGVCASQLLPPGIAIFGKVFELDAMPMRPFDMASTFSLLRVTTEFFAGLLLFRAFQILRQQDGREFGRLSLVLAALLILTLHTTRVPPLIQDPLAVALTALLILSVALAPSPADFLERRVPLLLGHASYSIYMVHGVVVLTYRQLVEQHAVPSDTPLGVACLIVAIGIMLVIALGILMHRYVEAPSREALRSLVHRTRQPQMQRS